jgi:EAL domain-containing protein (putative c-di-GMP-specific phosphodiesterase class I)
LPIIAISGGGFSLNRDLLHKATELGASAVMRKPFDADQLIEIVAKCLDAARSRSSQAIGADATRTAVAELAAAIAGDQLFLEYQPKLDYRLARITGVEALVRWRHPERGTINPDKLIALAEESGLINRVTDWVVGEAARQVADWGAVGLNLGVSVNISAHDVADPQLPTRLTGLCSTAGIAPTLMTLELPQGYAMHDASAIKDALQRLRHLGFGLSVDNFGADASSLVQLKRLPFNEFKIDRPFIKEMMSSPESRQRVEMMVGLSRRLDLRCVAEGVEDGAAFNALREIGCEAAQGYFLSRPVPGQQIGEFVRRYNANASA